MLQAALAKSSKRGKPTSGPNLFLIEFLSRTATARFSRASDPSVLVPNATEGLREDDSGDLDNLTVLHECTIPLAKPVLPPFAI